MTRPLACTLLLAAAFGAWEVLFADFMADDLMQLSVLEGVSPAAAWTGPFNLYTLSDGIPAHVRAMKDAGLFPWFADPAYEMAFFRPLSSGLLALDHALFGLHPSGYRLHGVLWSLALVAAVGWILRRALPGRTATIALLVFVLSAIHGMFCWTATRHVVIAAALGFAALAAHIRWREDGWRPGKALSMVALALSLAASEVGVAVAVYHEPGAFLLELPARLAVLTGGMIVGGSGVDLWVLRPALRPPLALVDALATAVFVVTLYAAWREMPMAQRRAAGWLGVAVITSAIPFAGTPIGARCLLVPFVGGASLIAVVIDRWWFAWRHQLALPRRALGVACVVLAFIHLGIAPLGRLGTPILLRHGMAERAAAAVRDAELDPTTLPRQTAVVLVVPDLVIGLHGGFYRVLHRLPMPAAWRVLSGGPAPHRFVRTGSDTLEMEVGDGGIESATLQPGTVVTLRDMEATVLTSGKLGPSRVRMRFDRLLDDPSLTLLAWRGERLRRVAAPPVGGVITIP